jgi:hypothetical protein
MAEVIFAAAERYHDGGKDSSKHGIKRADKVKKRMM